MVVNSDEECEGAYSVLMLSEEGTNCPETEPLCFTEIPSSTQNQMLYDAQLKCQNHTKLQMDDSIFAPSILDIDIEKGKVETAKPNAENLGSLKTEDSLTRALQRELSSHVGGKFMQLLLNNSLELPKFSSRDKCMTERVFDTPANRLRKYKRSTSFNSRRVVLLFSVLSSMGTMILIYLTLRVKQISEASANM